MKHVNYGELYSIFILVNNQYEFGQTQNPVFQRRMGSEEKFDLNQGPAGVRRASPGEGTAPSLAPGVGKPLDLMT